MTEKINNAFLFNDEGHLNDEGVAFYAEKMITHEIHHLPDLVLQHVMECQQCKMQCLELSNILRLQGKEGLMGNDGEGSGSLGGSGPIMVPPDGNKKNNVSYGLIFKIAAGILLIMGIGWVLMKGMKSMKDENNTLADSKTKTDSVYAVEGLKSKHALDQWIEKWELLFPGSQGVYQLNPSLESMLSMVFRSHDFIVSEPDSITDYKEGKEIVFDWSDKKGKEVELKIISRDGILIHKRHLSHHSSYVVNKTLAPGLYYWFIEQSNVTVAGGRFGIIPDQ